MALAHFLVYIFTAGVIRNINFWLKENQPFSKKRKSSFASFNLQMYKKKVYEDCIKSFKRS